VRSSSVVGRVAAVGAVIIAVIAVGVIVLGGGGDYTVKAMFENASQIVSGDLVQVSGVAVGTVSDIRLTPAGQAELTLDINDKHFAPLRQGTTATIREVSLSGIANRYVDLDLGPATGASIPSGGTLPTTATRSEVDLDEIFDTLDPKTRQGLQQVIQGSAAQYAGKAVEAQKALEYLNPAIATASMLFSELNRNTDQFTNFLVKSSNLVTDLSERAGDLSGLIRNLGTTTSALAAQRTALGSSIQRLPGFMALADTTFVNLRNALNDLQPLVDATRPVAPKLQQLLIQLRPLAEDAVPTVRDLANIIRRPGPDNDLTELTELGVPLADATVRNINANGKTRPGAFPVSVQALNESTPELAFARPYAVDLTGWFEGFSHPGIIDANGAASRIVSVTNQLSATDAGVINGLPLQSQLNAIANAITQGSTSSPITTEQGDRCPGSQERGALYYPESGYQCNPNQVPTGP
jgi:phospholipid/cholesterol/gamma-HCH transport system substrate-binding protein